MIWFSRKAFVAAVVFTGSIAIWLAALIWLLGDGPLSLALPTAAALGAAYYLGVCRGLEIAEASRP